MLTCDEINKKINELVLLGETTYSKDCSLRYLSKIKGFSQYYFIIYMAIVWPKLIVVEVVNLWFCLRF